MFAVVGCSRRVVVGSTASVKNLDSTGAFVLFARRATRACRCTVTRVCTFCSVSTKTTTNSLHSKRFTATASSWTCTLAACASSTSCLTLSRCGRLLCVCMCVWQHSHARARTNNRSCLSVARRISCWTSSSWRARFKKRGSFIEQRAMFCVCVCCLLCAHCVRTHERVYCIGVAALFVLFVEFLFCLVAWLLVFFFLLSYGFSFPLFQTNTACE